MNHTITSDLDALSYETVDRLPGLVLRASALQSEGPEFDSRPGHTKDFKKKWNLLPLCLVLSISNGVGKTSQLATAGKKAVACST